MNKKDSETTKIAIISNSIENLSFLKFNKKYKFDELIFESENQLGKNKIFSKNSIYFDWNEKYTLLILRIESIAFDIEKTLKNSVNIGKIKFLLGNNADNKLVYRVAKRVTLDTYAEILRSLLTAHLHLNRGNKVTLLFKKNRKEAVNKVLEYLKLKDSTSEYNWHGIEKIHIKYIGSATFSNIKDYFKSLGVGIYFLSSIRKIRINKKENYKIGLLTWTSSKIIGESYLNNEGLDAVLPENTAPKDVLVYGKNKISPQNLERIKSRGFSFTKFDLENIYRKSSLKDIFILISLIMRILLTYPIISSSVSKPLKNRLAYITYQYFKWNKFVNSYSLQLSIGYLEYSLGDLIRNYVLIKNGTCCCSYNHSISESSNLNRDFMILDTWKSFVPFTKRFFILPAQIEKYNLSKISFKKSFITGPLFTNNKSFLKIPSDLSNKTIVTVFSSSLNSSSFNNKQSHKLFLDSFFQFLDKYSEKITFLFCLKYKQELLDSKLDLNIEKIKNHIKKRNIIFMDNSVKTTDLIRSSNAVISMPFTTPTVEAIALKIPAIYFDPIGLFPENIFNEIDDFYIDNYEKFKTFLEKIIDKDLNLHYWINKVNYELGISKDMEGIKIIQSEINKVIKKI